MRSIIRLVVSLSFVIATLPASASFHLWAMTELYSNADGSVQFLEMRALSGSEQFFSGHVLTASGGGVTHRFTVPSDLPGDSSGRRMIFATQGFAALGIIVPDYIVPNGFFPVGGGTANWADADVWNYPALPTNGNDSLNRDGSRGPNSPQNFAGQTGHVSVAAPAPSVSLSARELDFGTVAVGNRAGPSGVTLLSSGGAAYRITALTSTPGDCTGAPMCSGSDFACTTTCVVGEDMAANASCSISATFAPAAAGTRSTTVNICDNAGGRTLSIKGTGTTAAAAVNVQGLWFASPAFSESGWGVNLAQQGDIVFATWFTYDTDGSGMWLVMSEGRRQAGTNTYQGQLFRTTGPSFDSASFDPARVIPTPVGSGTFAFTDASNGTFTYTVNNVTQTKAITRQLFASPLPTCVEGGPAGSAPNFSDLWFRAPAFSESGWGVNLTQQGDVLFVTWFTYDANGKGLWLVGSDVRRTSGNTFTGQLFRTTGPAFSASPFNPSQVVPVPVGTATFTFGDANNGTFAYTVNGISQSKPITRQVFSSPATVCR